MTPSPTRPSTTTATVRTPVPDPPRRECQHLRTTAQGSNSFVYQVKCKDCGYVITRARKQPLEATGTSTTSTPAPPTCPHHWTTWRGSNGSMRIRTCRDCGHRERFAVEATDERGMQGRQPGLSSQRVNTRYFDDSVPVPKERMAGVTQTFHELVMRRIQDLEDGAEVPAQRLHEALDLAIATSTTWTTSFFGGPREATAWTSSPTASSTRSNTASPARTPPHGARFGADEVHRNLKAPVWLRWDATSTPSTRTPSTTPTTGPGFLTTSGRRVRLE